MKVIIDEKIESVSAASENANYPASSMLNRHPKRVWKAADGVSDTRISLTVDSLLTDVGIVNTNAKEVYISRPVFADFTFESGGDDVEWTSPGGTVFNWYISDYTDSKPPLIDTDTGDIWVDGINLYGGTLLTLRLIAEDGETVQVGVVSGGVAEEFRDPYYGVEEIFNDYSVQAELSNGSHYYKKGNIVREFGFQALMERDTEAFVLMRSVGLKKGQEPLMWKITEINHSQWLVYGRATITQNHTAHRHNSLSVNIKEVI